MPRCPRCAAATPDDAPACAGCGRLLVAVGPEPPGPDPLPPLGPHGPPPQSAFVLRPVGAGVRFRGRPAGDIPVGADALLIGRKDPLAGVHPDIDLGGVADFGFTSRRHAEVRVAGGRLVVTDVAGYDTTAVNDPTRPLPVGVPVPLSPGDRLIVGEAVTFVVDEADGA